MHFFPDHGKPYRQQLENNASTLGYGYILLLLAALMALYLEIFMVGFSPIQVHLYDFFVVSSARVFERRLSHVATMVLHFITILDGLLASLIACRNIVKWLLIKPAILVLCCPFRPSFSVYRP